MLDRHPLGARRSTAGGRRALSRRSSRLDPFKGMDSCVSIDAPKNFRIKGVNVVDRQPGKPASTVRWWTDEAAEAERMSELWHKGQPRHGMEDKGDDSCVSVEAPEWMRTHGSPVAVRTGDQKRPFVSAKWWKYEEDGHLECMPPTPPLPLPCPRYTNQHAAPACIHPRCAQRAPRFPLARAPDDANKLPPFNSTQPLVYRGAQYTPARRTRRLPPARCDARGRRARGVDARIRGPADDERGRATKDERALRASASARRRSPNRSSFE